MKGKSVVSISAAVVYMACKQCDVVRTLEEICRGVCLPKDKRSLAYMAHQCKTTGKLFERILEENTKYRITKGD